MVKNTWSKYTKSKKKNEKLISFTFFHISHEKFFQFLFNSTDFIIRRRRIRLSTKLCIRGKWKHFKVVILHEVHLTDEFLLFGC